MFGNLRTATKLFILSGMFIVSIAVATYSLVAEKQAAGYGKPGIAYGVGVT